MLIFTKLLIKIDKYGLHDITVAISTLEPHIHVVVCLFPNNSQIFTNLSKAYHYKKQ